MNEPHAPPSVPLARLLRQAAAELAAQPVPPMAPGLLDPREADGAAAGRRLAAGAHAPADPQPGATPAGGPRAGIASIWTRITAAGPQARRRTWAGALAGAALVAGVGWFVLVAALPPGGEGPPVAVAAGDRFVPVVSSDRWLRLAGEGPAPAWVLQAEVPREQLAAWGLPYDPGRAAEPLRAELLLNPAGEVLAVRVVHRPVSPRP